MPLPTKRYSRGHKPVNNGLSVCADCGEDLERAVVGTWLVPGDRDPEIAYYRHRRRKRPAGLKPIPDNDRTHCSSCGRPFKAYELKPGDGRCVECTP